MLDDVLDPETTNDILPEDVRWAESALPHITLVTDRIDFSTLRALRVGPHVRVLALSGGGFPDRPDEGIDAGALAQLLDDVRISKRSIADPVRLLAAFTEGVSGPHAALFQVYAPDPVRDGIRPGEALLAADLAERSGVFPPFDKEPGKPPSKPEVEDDSISAADWMILQDRFAHQFEIIPAREWSSDQMPVAGWVRLPDEERKTLQPYVDYEGRRYRPSEHVLAFSLSVFASLQEKPARSEVIDTPEAGTEARPEKTPSGGVHPDALDVLTRKLLALSGFGGSDEPLTGWLAAQDEGASA